PSETSWVEFMGFGDECSLGEEEPRLASSGFQNG
ncbi:hypothetical protein A2U01_0065979, partial [Trifolium medium]|nr:hypothetical protein [Trifolium medium]